MARKHVRFNYFEVKLVPAKEAFKKQITDPDGDDHTFSSADLWNMTSFLEYIDSKKDNFDTSVLLGDEVGEVEPGSIIYTDKYKTYGFQLSKLVETNIPSKKKIGRIKEEIMLEDDEFIGHFVTIIYDKTLNVVMVQSNLYGLSTVQIEQYLTELRLKYLEEIGCGNEEVLAVRLTPILDHSKLKTALQADYYRKLKIKGSDISLDSALDGSSMISDARRTLFKMKGVNIEITVSLGVTEKTASLDEEEVREVLKEFQKINPDQRPKIELTMKEYEEAPIEVINLIEPRMTDRLSLEVEPRKTIGHGFLHDKMLEKYIQRKSDIRRVLGIIE
ncbi:DUF6731 family protein [Paenibacillus faecalis]|uniref:DUF6731 family protein n=1 Tax=Paenibacillus faecalis TaxID=2079532 RepID=UPI000D0F7FAB|nr:DUF6731 family protein [Paenibacillus faecalis]